MRMMSRPLTSKPISPFSTMGRVEADVEDAGIDGGLFNGLDKLGEALGEGNATALDADESEVGAAVVALDNFMGEANEGALDLGGGHEAALLAEVVRGGGRCGFGAALGIGLRIAHRVAHGLPLMIAADGLDER
jgi:hypothetical protein